MDNICHSLAGLALADAGLKKRTALATATAVIGANLPDLDVLAYLDSPVTALGFRRGWTHGALALAVGPFLLAALMLAWDRLVRRRRDPAAPPADPRGLLLVAALAILSHPLLDLLNTYGARLLMPFSGRWFHGDSLFIVDPWVWLALLAGSILARWRGSPAPARLALGACGIYIVAMAATSIVARGVVRRALAANGMAAGHLMAAPLPLVPLGRVSVASVPAGYILGRLSPSLRYQSESDVLMSNAATPAARYAAATPAGRVYLRWARFPYFVAGPYDGCPPLTVCIRDARYPGQGWAEIAVPLPIALSPLSSLPSPPSRLPSTVYRLPSASLARPNLVEHP